MNKLKGSGSVASRIRAFCTFGPERHTVPDTFEEQHLQFCGLSTSHRDNSQNERQHIPSHGRNPTYLSNIRDNPVVACLKHSFVRLHFCHVLFNTSRKSLQTDVVFPHCLLVFE